MSIRHCDCIMRHGITHKNFNWLKIFQCDEHGLICPFDSWQFKEPERLLEHIKGGQDQIIKCDGIFNYGNYGIADVVFELETFILTKNKRCD